MTRSEAPLVARYLITALCLLLLQLAYADQAYPTTSELRIAQTTVSPSPSPEICAWSTSDARLRGTVEQCFVTTWSRRPTITKLTPVSYEGLDLSLIASNTRLSTSSLSQEVTLSATVSTSSLSQEVISSATLTANKTSVETQGAYRTERSEESPIATTVLVESATPKTTHVSETVALVVPATEIDDDSALDTANFLSFEEWKKQNLEQAGQSAENLGSRDGGPVERKRGPGPINNALDALGEDVEINIDFGGFASRVDEPRASQPQQTEAQERQPMEQQSESQKHTPKENAGQRKRPKDAGKTCKERTNYASYDCAATTLKTNPECKSSSAILVENKDSYMLNICSVKNKFFIVELCDNILVDTIVLANFEFFSSMFRVFKVSVSDQYPVKQDKWKELGTFEARNTRQIQAFLVENPLIWARYLRVEILTSYGAEYYCPVSLLRVHGTTMMEEFNSEMKEFVGEDDSDADSDPVGIEHPIVDLVKPDDFADTAGLERNGKPAISRASTTDGSSISESMIQDTTASTESLATSLSIQITSVVDKIESIITTHLPPPAVTTTRPAAEVSSTEVDNNAVHSTQIPETKTAAAADSSSSIIQTEAQHTPEVIITASITPSMRQIIEKSESIESNTKISSYEPVPFSATNTSSIAKTATQPPTSNPTTQESFFKSVHKRLQFLETNSTLSLQYIEEQSRILRDAFSKVERRQIAKTDQFLALLNSTVMTELLDIRSQYDRIWQSTAMELAYQREQSKQDVVILSSRLRLLTDEVVFQKRMAFLQFLLILICLGFVIFSKHNSPNAYFEMPALVQHALSRSSVSLNTMRNSPDQPYDTPPDSPPAAHAHSLLSCDLSSACSSPQGCAPYTLNRERDCRDNEADDSPTRSRGTSLHISYAPPTPTSRAASMDPTDLSNVLARQRQDEHEDPTKTTQGVSRRNSTASIESPGLTMDVLSTIARNHDHTLCTNTSSLAVHERTEAHRVHSIADSELSITRMNEDVSRRPNPSRTNTHPDDGDSWAT